MQEVNPQGGSCPFEVGKLATEKATLTSFPNWRVSKKSDEKRKILCCKDR